MSNVLFSGIIPALVTPLDRAEHINEDTARRLMRWHLDAGADGMLRLSCFMLRLLLVFRSTCAAGTWR